MAANQQQCLNLPNEFSSSAQWQQWHVALVSCVGKQAANSLWIQFWDNKGTLNENAYSAELSQYMRSQGVAIEESGGQRIARNIGDLGSWIGTGFQFTRLVTFVLIGGVSVAFLLLLYNIVMNPSKAKQSVDAIANGAANVVPAGRVSKLLK
jgi:hypothetical protein